MPDAKIIAFPVRPRPVPVAQPGLWSAFENTALRFPDRIAIRDADGGMTYAALRHMASQLAERLTRIAEAAGPDHHQVGMLGQNSAAHLVTLFACARAGLTMVPINWRLSEEEWRWQAEDARLCAVIEGFGHRMPEAFMQHHGIATLTAGTLRLLPREYAPGPDRATPDTPVLLCYTSGTTGRPKGAVLTQGAVLANARHAQLIFSFTPQDVVLTVLPMFHVGGLNIQTVPALLAGATVVLHQKFDPELFFDTLARDRPTATLLVPAVMRALVEHPRWVGADLSCLRAVGAGSSIMSPADVAAFNARGLPVQIVYGATETAPIAIAQTREEAAAHPAALGLPIGDCAARLGPDGEIQLRGPNVMHGYWKTPPGEGFSDDGWFRTGDLGAVDSNGRWHFTDRLKHIIISGGENISPAEVERVLATAPGVAECAVVGRTDPRWGEVPIAVVVPAEGFNADAVLHHFEGRLARFKHPRAVVTLPTLPRTALGKVNIAELKRMLG